MNNQAESLATEIYDLNMKVFWLSSIPSLLEIIAFILILVASIYIFTKTKAPGSLMICIGLVFALLFAMAPIFLGSTNEGSNVKPSNIAILFEILSSFFIFLAGFGFFKYAVTLKKTNES